MPRHLIACFLFGLLTAPLAQAQVGVRMPTLPPELAQLETRQLAITCRVHFNTQIREMPALYYTGAGLTSSKGHNDLRDALAHKTAFDGVPALQVNGISEDELAVLQKTFDQAQRNGDARRIGTFCDQWGTAVHEDALRSMSREQRQAYQTALSVQTLKALRAKAPLDDED